MNFTGRPQTVSIIQRFDDGIWYDPVIRMEHISDAETEDENVLMKEDPISSALVQGLLQLAAYPFYTMLVNREAPCRRFSLPRLSSH